VLRAQSPILEKLPEPQLIRSRLSELAAEANFLRALLRLFEERECGRRLLRQQRKDVRHAG
jgi:hypothetical protein